MAGFRRSDRRVPVTTRDERAVGNGEGIQRRGGNQMRSVAILALMLVATAAGCDDVDTAKPPLPEPTRTTRRDAAVDPLVSQGDRALRAGQYSEALARFDAVLRRSPDRLEVRARRAIALFGLGQATAAGEEIREIRRRRMANLDSALQRQADDVALLLRAARARSELQDHEAALAHARRATALAPSLAEAHFTLGNVLYRAGRLREALGSYDRALLLDPGKTEAYAARGTARRRTGDYAGAASDLRRVREAAP